MENPLTTEQIQELKSFDTCLLTDAIESFGVRLRNEGFATGAFKCLFKHFPPMVGYAATCKVRSADPPITGTRYTERIEWWTRIGSASAPWVLVMQDVDDPPGTGAFLGKVHAHILAALGCVGAITNGAAREAPGLEASGLQVYASRLATSRAYIHMVECETPVELDHLTIHPGDLIHGDEHGVITIPPELVRRLPAAARAIAAKKARLIEAVKSRGATLEDFNRGLKDLLDFDPESPDEGEQK